MAIHTSGWPLGALSELLHGIVSATALIDILVPVVHPRMGSTLSASPEIVGGFAALAS